MRVTSNQTFPLFVLAEPSSYSLFSPLFFPLLLFSGGFDKFSSLYPFLLSPLPASMAIGVGDGSSPSSSSSPVKNYPTHIFDFLYLGSYEHACSMEVLKRLGITRIVNMADELTNRFEGQIQYTNGHADDRPEHNLKAVLPGILQVMSK